MGIGLKHIVVAEGYIPSRPATELQAVGPECCRTGGDTFAALRQKADQQREITTCF